MKGLTQNGFVKSSPEEIKEELISELRLKIPEFTEQPADLQNNILDTSIEGILKYEDMLSTLFNAYSPSYSNNDLFLKFAESVGLRARQEFKAQVTLTFDGKYGDFIPRNTIVTDGNNEFITQENAVIGTTQEVDILALSETENICEPNTINILKSILTEGISVNNKVASLKYIPNENIKDLKARAQAKLRSARPGGKMYASQLLKGLPGVDPRLVAFYNKEFEVRTGEVTHYVQGIESVIGGGENEKVALALYNSFLETQKLISKPSNNEITRSVEVTLYVFNNPVPIKFTRPKGLQIGLQLNVVFTSSLSTPIALQGISQDAVTKYINSLQVGTPVSKFALIDIIMPLFIDAGIPSHTIQSMEFNYKVGEAGEYGSMGDFMQEIEYDCYVTLIEYGVVING